MMKTETVIEKAYRLLFYYIVFYHNPIRKLKDEDKYNALLENLYINKNELELIIIQTARNLRLQNGYIQNQK